MSDDTPRQHVLPLAALLRQPRARPSRRRLTKDSLVVRSHRLLTQSVWLVEPTVHTYRLLLLAIASIDPTSETPEQVALSARTISDVFENMHGPALSRVCREAAMILKTLQYVRADDEDPDTAESWTTRAVVTDAEYHRGTLRLIFNPRMLAHLVQIRSEMSVSRLRYFAAFRSATHFRLYDLLAPQVNRGAWSIAVSDFRQLMGVADDEYPQFKELNRRVLSPCLDMINLTSDLYAKCRLIPGPGNRIGQIEFSVTRTRDITSTPAQEALVEVLVSQGMARGVASERVAYSGVRHALLCLAKYLMRREGKSPVANPGGYLTTLFAEPNIDMGASEQADRSLELAYDMLCERLYAQATEGERQLLLKQFGGQLDAPRQGWLTKGGVAHPAVKPIWRVFLRTVYQPNLLLEDTI